MQNTTLFQVGIATRWTTAVSSVQKLRRISIGTVHDPRIARVSTAQLEELLTDYGRIAEVWIDIPQALPRGYRHELYTIIRAWQPETIIVMNQGLK